MTRKSTFVHSFLMLGILVSGVSRVAATPVTYSSLPLQADHADDVTAGNLVQAQFLGTLSPGNYGTETYESYTANEGYSGPFAFGATGIIANSTFYNGVVEPGSGYVYSGLNALLEFPFFSDEEDEDPIPAPTGANTFYLSTPVTSFGTWIDQAGDADADTLSLQLQNSQTMTSEIVPIGTLGPDADPSNIFFFGVTDTASPFDEVTLLMTNDDDGILLDNTTVGVPEPNSLALVFGSLLIGLVAFFVRRASARREVATVPACGSC